MSMDNNCEINNLPNELINKLNKVHSILSDIAECPLSEKLSDKHNIFTDVVLSLDEDVNKFISSNKNFDISIVYKVYHLCLECCALFTNVNYAYCHKHEAPSVIIEEVYNNFEVLNKLKLSIEGEEYC